ncbi:hypothetical protein Drose_16140 [Dactylosporangium roseum]|uniref:Uncharacterized protein n=1 Tax=Dactylosporangium roseum TaxID=47989 RepID=A0ABY5ZF80_9ACTN|nr:hypothetical protein [Dactylosporangium roseum]UWZ39615.1 hypothetical protein Drose_16140 [Dactylosporangium roseum]
MTNERPTGLLYLLVVGRETELVIRMHDIALNTDAITGWTSDGAIQPLVVSLHGGQESQPSTLLLNFTHVIGGTPGPVP